MVRPISLFIIFLVAAASGKQPDQVSANVVREPPGSEHIMSRGLLVSPLSLVAKGQLSSGLCTYHHHSQRSTPLSASSFHLRRFLYPSQCTSNSTVGQTCASHSKPTFEMSFFAKLEKRVAAIDSHLCVGLDPHIKELFPEVANENGKRDREPTEQEKCDKAFEFCKAIIDATGELCYL